MARLLLFLFAFVISSVSFAQIEGTYEVKVTKKAEEKKSNRWTLADWLAWKEQAKAQDMWLAKNSHSSAFEFYLEAAALNYTHTDSGSTSSLGNYNLYSGELAAYAGVAGLKGAYGGSQENESSWTGSFNLRLFGRAIQDTHINLEYGLRGLTLNPSGKPMENFQNQYGGATLAIYLTKHLGIEGTYRKILPANSDQGRGLEGEISTGEVFIDFNALRIFGRWQREFRQYWQSGSTSGEFREGYGGGLRLFF